MRDFIDKTSEQSGTPLNRSNMMAIQGFDAEEKIRDGNATRCLNSNNEILTINDMNNDGVIQIIFTGSTENGSKQLYMDIAFTPEGIKKVIS